MGTTLFAMMTVLSSLWNSVKKKMKLMKNKIKKKTNEPLKIEINKPPKIPQSASTIIPRNLIQKHRNSNHSTHNIKTTIVVKRETTRTLQPISTKKVHRAKITEIIPQDENIFTCSLDYTAKLQDQLTGQVQ